MDQKVFGRIWEEYPLFLEIPKFEVNFILYTRPTFASVAPVVDILVKPIGTAISSIGGQVYPVVGSNSVLNIVGAYQSSHLQGRLVMPLYAGDMQFQGSIGGVNVVAQDFCWINLYIKRIADL